jgi:hypothetical protein
VEASQYKEAFMESIVVLVVILTITITVVEQAWSGVLLFAKQTWP